MLPRLGSLPPKSSSDCALDDGAVLLCWSAVICILSPEPDTDSLLDARDISSLMPDLLCGSSSGLSSDASRDAGLVCVGRSDLIRGPAVPPKPVGTPSHLCCSSFQPFVFSCPCMPCGDSMVSASFFSVSFGSVSVLCAPTPSSYPALVDKWGLCGCRWGLTNLVCGPRTAPSGSGLCLCCVY